MHPCLCSPPNTPHAVEYGEQVESLQSPTLTCPLAKGSSICALVAIGSVASFWCKVCFGPLLL